MGRVTVRTPTLFCISLKTSFKPPKREIGPRLIWYMETEKSDQILQTFKYYSEDHGEKLGLIISQDVDKINTLIKYMSMDKFMDAFVGRYFYLANPAQWEDPFEMNYIESLKIDIIPNSKNLLKYKVYATCFKTKSEGKDEANENAAWYSYIHDTSKVIRIAFRAKDLEASVDEYASLKNLHFYLAKENYIDRKEIVCLHPVDKTLDGNDKFDDLNDRKDECLFIKNFVLKQNAYRYEQEVRLCLIEESEYWEKSKRIEDFDWLKNIDHITLPPINIKNDPEAYKKIKSNIELYRIIKYLNRDIKVMQSNLYNTEEEEMETEIKL